MKRKTFLKSTTLGFIGLSCLSYTKILQEFSQNDLLGKGKPVLYGENYKLREEAHLSFLKMREKASQSNIHIKVVSSYRNYDHQNRIWERKFKKFTAEGLSPTKAIQKIIEYSTIPGTSRHHWGTDLDIVDGNAKQPKGLLLEKNFHENGPFCKFKEWMDQNAKNFGYYLVYTDEKERKGFKYEPWHYSYAPLSRPMLQHYKSLDIKNILQQNKLLGSTYFTDQLVNDYITNNIMDINPVLL